MSNKKQDIQSKLKRLDELVAYFEDSDNTPDIDSSLSNYEEAMKLVAEIKTELQGVTLKIKEIQAKYSSED
ncbi:exodeoxyribonuclease VII small subunit [Candidatus Dojkabacteria bacterium]|uniref:Exodeoxyribonuclease VII small subunit n=1 Tax=Candidatus Dojkabacteria bacterium TaxID=2099670 RepID=A0A952AK05_9BACT|nr:exodeoxyribonuclease VII small subunit [Candidatus Dojkabacteria bacterium]